MGMIKRFIGKLIGACGDNWRHDWLYYGDTFRECTRCHRSQVLTGEYQLDSDLTPVMWWSDTWDTHTKEGPMSVTDRPKLKTCTYHAQDRLYFNRLANDDVVIEKIGEDGKVLFRQQLYAGQWVSAVLSMTRQGERGNDWQTFMQHHKGTRDVFAWHAALKQIANEEPNAVINERNPREHEACSVCQHMIKTAADALKPQTGEVVQ